MQQAIEPPLQVIEKIARKQLWENANVKKIAIGENQRSQSHNAEKLSVRKAHLSDVEEIFHLLSYWTHKGETLARSRTSITADIKNFVVAEIERKVVGCASIYYYSSQLAELRSVAVDGDSHGLGQGKAMTHYLLDKARLLQIPRIIVLTRVPRFFTKMGFSETDIARFPEKILKDCRHCPKQVNCDEIAMEFLQAVEEKNQIELSAIPLSNNKWSLSNTMSQPVPDSCPPV